MKQTHEQEQIIAVLDALAASMDAEYIEKRLLEAGYFKAGDDKRTKSASLVDITRSDTIEGMWTEDKKFAYQFSLHYNTKGYEKYEFAWLHVVKDNGKGVGIPYIERIYAREI